MIDFVSFHYNFDLHPQYGMMYMYSQVLSKSTGVADCTGAGKKPELVIVQYRINVDITLSKLISAQGLL